MLKYLLALLLVGFAAGAADAQWIWTSEPPNAAQVERYFRRVLPLGRAPARATLSISCDSQYEVYINGKLVGSGNEYRLPGQFSVERYLNRGMNVIAVKAAKLSRNGGLLLEMDGGPDFHLVSDKTWIWNKVEVKFWTQPEFEGVGWDQAKELGGPATAPWNLAGWPNVTAAKEDLKPGAGNFVNGFSVPPGFTLETYATDADTSSVLAMTFNGSGQLLTAAAGSGPTEIRMLEDSHGYCTGHHLFYPGLHCQGMCAVGNDIYAIGNGKLYFLKDAGGKADVQEPVGSQLLGSMSEHGPHAIAHGPDGHFYIMLGNDSSFPMSALSKETSPLREEHLYWGNLLPIQSSNGFMDGKGPPGGRIVRTDIKGQNYELIACGIRNAYDFAFASNGEMFSFDSDMEWDIGLPWYRAVRTMHVVTGAEYGWRYGSGKWKAWLPDSAPGMTDVGRGSPTGVEVYNHVALPEEYRDAVFLCDWSRGRVLVMKPQRDGATWKGDPVEFISAKGPNFPVTHCSVGPDGALYFGYGGRGALGGILRVRYIGGKAMGVVFPAAELQGIPPAIAQALGTPQYQSAFGRAAIARSKQQAGAAWGAALAAVARDRNRTERVRSRALDFLTMNGETLPATLLLELSKDPSPLIRAQAVQRITLNGDATSRAELKTFLKDPDPWVLRRACEGLLTSTDPAATPGLIALLGHPDRFVRYTASNALMRRSPDTWSDAAASTGSNLARANGLLARARWFQSLVINGSNIAPYFDKMLREEIDLLSPRPTPDEALTALRAVALTLLARTDNSVIPANLKTDLVYACIAMLKSDDVRLSMDAAELLGYVGDARGVAPLIAKLKNDLSPRDERVHYAIAVSAIPEGWTAQLAADVLEVLAVPGAGENGAAFVSNLSQSAARLGKHLPAELRKDTYNLLSPLAKGFAATVTGFDVMSVQGLADAVRKSQSFQERADLIAKIAAPGNDESFRTLERLADPESPLYDVLLAQLMRFNHADAKKYAVAALASASRGLAGSALERVKELFKEDPEDQNVYYGLLVCGARFPENRGAALDLLKKWTIDDKALAKLPAKPDEQLEYWENVFREAFKKDKRPFPALSGEGYQQPEKFAKLRDFISANSPVVTGNAAAGKELFKSARCSNCHAFKGEGQQFGPELTDVAKRFDMGKILDDIVYPSRVVDARYRQIVFVVKDGRRVTGFVSKETDDSLTVIASDASATELKKADITKRAITDQSIMPNGLVDALTPEQIRDLLGYLGGKQ